MWHEEKAHINVEEREIVAADRGAWRMMVKKGIEAAKKDRRDRKEEKDGIVKQQIRSFSNSIQHTCAQTTGKTAMQGWSDSMK